MFSPQFSGIKVIHALGCPDSLKASSHITLETRSHLPHALQFDVADATHSRYILFDRDLANMAQDSFGITVPEELYTAEKSRASIDTSLMDELNGVNAQFAKQLQVLSPEGFIDKVVRFVNQRLENIPAVDANNNQIPVYYCDGIGVVADMR